MNGIISRNSETIVLLWIYFLISHIFFFYLYDSLSLSLSLGHEYLCGIQVQVISSIAVFSKLTIH